MIIIVAIDDDDEGTTTNVKFNGTTNKKKWSFIFWLKFVSFIATYSPKNEILLLK